MKKIFMVLLLLPFTAIYFQIRGCEEIESKIKNFEFKLNENNQIDETNQQDFLDIWKDACDCVPEQEKGTKADCQRYKKVKVPWGPHMLWSIRRPFSSELKEPCLQLEWPVIIKVNNWTWNAVMVNKCVADECLLKAHYAYTLYKKIKKQIWYRQPNLEEKRILEALEKDMSKNRHYECWKTWMNDYKQKVINEKNDLGWYEVRNAQRNADQSGVRRRGWVEAPRTVLSRGGTG